MKWLDIAFKFLLLIFSNNNIAAQCIIGIKFLSSDQEVEAFSTEYSGCPVVNGNIVISSGVTNLLSLSFLEGINGSLSFVNTETDLLFDGLENLRFIKDDLTLQGVFFNNDAPAFPSLVAIDSNLLIYNSTLTNPNIFEKIEHIGGNLNIYKTQLDSLVSFKNIRVLNDFFISESSIQSFEGLKNLDSIRGYMRWEYLPFVSFSGLENLSYIETLRIYKCNGFTSLKGLGGLRTINGYSEITRCDSFTSLLGLQDIVFNGPMHFSYNPRLEDCHVLTICETLINGTGSLYFQSNASGCETNLQIKNQCESSVDGFDFLNQADLDQFAIDHPDTMHVIGNINVKGFDIIDLSALNKIKSTQGSISINSNGILPHLNGFEALESIGHSLDIVDNIELLNLDGFQKLRSIGRDLSIEACEELISISGLSAVTHVGRDVRIQGNPVLKNLEALSGIKKIEGIFFAYFNHSLESLAGLENLDSISGKFTVGYCDGLKSVDEFNPAHAAGGLSFIGLDSLSSINGYTRLLEIPNGGVTIRNLDQIVEIEGFQNLEGISDVLSFYGLKQLNSIEGFSSLREIGILDIDFCDSLRDAALLPSLEIVNHEFILNRTALASFPNIELGDSLEQLEIRSNPYLLELPNFQRLSYVAGNISVIDNPLIQNLAGLSKLNFIDIGLYLNENERLHDISSLKNLSVVDYYLSIQNNHELDECNIRAFCDLLNEAPNRVVIRGNQPSCHKSTIDCSFYGFSGHVYFDENLNGLRDSGEYTMPNMRIDNTHNQSWNVTNALGKWYYSTDESIIHTFEWVDNETFYLSSDSMRYIRLFVPGADSNSNLDFGIFHKNPFHSAETHIYPLAPTICNNVVPFRVGIMNNGSYTDSFFVDLRYNDLLRFDSVGFSLDKLDTVNRNLLWNTGPIRPFEIRYFVAYMQVADETHLGEPYKVEVFTKIDKNSEATYSRFEEIILCSYDPNDKLVNPLPRQGDNLSLKAEPFTYTIRFQNTGNIEAVNIQISDTLDVSLDWSTFQVVASSHQLHTALSYNGIATFSFNNIFLPDSSSSPEGSQGFVTYAINPLPGLDDYTLVRNTAYYFDGNQPIVTNSTLNILVDEFPLVAVEDNTRVTKWRMRPNPVQNILYIDTNIDLLGGRIVDLLGRNLWSSDFVYNSIDLTWLPSGMYWLVLRDKNGESIQVFIKR